MLCGISVLIENKRRRREMALYVAPRAVYALMDEVLPGWLGRGRVGEVVGRWCERSVFATSLGVVTTAVCPSPPLLLTLLMHDDVRQTVYRPDLVSGVVSP